MRFAEPAILWALFAVPLLALLFAYTGLRRRRALGAFAGSEAHVVRFRGEVSTNRRAAKSIAVLVAVAAAIVAAARPQWGQGTETITRKGIDLAIVLDTSKSMAAADVAPSRLARGGARRVEPVGSIGRRSHRTRDLRRKSSRLLPADPRS